LGFHQQFQGIFEGLEATCRDATSHFKQM